jgi:hypothetical protein
MRTGIIGSEQLSDPAERSDQVEHGLRVVSS